VLPLSLKELCILELQTGSISISFLALFHASGGSERSNLVRHSKNL